MKIVLDYKKGWFGRFRKLKIYLDGDIHLTDMKQGERTEVEGEAGLRIEFLRRAETQPGAAGQNKSLQFGL